MYKFGFIGAGNMGSALAKGISKKAGGENIALCDMNTEKANALAAEIGAKCTDINDIAQSSEYIVLAVKPQSLEKMLGGISGILRSRDRFVFVTMAAGTPIARILAFAGVDAPVIRIMPNVPCTVGAGMILCAGNEAVTESELNAFVSALENCGRIDIIDEKNIDAYSVVTGCGPAYVYLMLEALADGMVECGVPRDKAYVYAAQMTEGSAKLMLETGRMPADLKDSVCSPGGTTIEGVRALEKGGFRSTLIEATRASYNRTLELTK